MVFDGSLEADRSPFISQPLAALVDVNVAIRVHHRVDVGRAVKALKAHAKFYRRVDIDAVANRANVVACGVFVYFFDVFRKII